MAETDSKGKKDQSAEPWLDFRREVAAGHDEKRRYPRLEFHCPVKIQGVEGVHRVTDIGMGGVFVEVNSASHLKLGQVLQLAMKLPTEYEPTKLKVQVANVRDRGVGFKFLDLSRENQEVIRVCFDTFKDTVPLAWDKTP